MLYHAPRARGTLRSTVAAASLTLVPLACAAQGAFVEALTGGETWIDARYRLERVEQDNPLEDATASTLRTRLGYQTGSYRGFSVLLEVSNTSAVGAESYNSTANQKTHRSVVADPETTRFNRYHLDFTGLPETTIRLGRQRLVFDNHRFVGNVGFRQQEQTFDGLRLTHRGLPDTTVDYALLTGVNRVFAQTHDRPVEHHLLNVRYEGLTFATLVGYGYLLDFRDAAPSSSTRTLGLRAAGSRGLGEGRAILYTLEYAHQRDHGSFPGSYGADYSLAELGASMWGLTLRAGHELLGSDAGRKGFETRLATLHAMNGWADQFLTTPAHGLRDLYFSVAGSLRGWSLMAVYRDFRATRGGAAWGDEWGLMARRPIGEHLAVELKYADYSAREHGVDTRKLWLTAELSF
jgi:hypothetical protein